MTYFLNSRPSYLFSMMELPGEGDISRRPPSTGSGNVTVSTSAPNASNPVPKVNSVSTSPLNPSDRLIFSRTSGGRWPRIFRRQGIRLRPPTGGFPAVAPIAEEIQYRVTSAITEAVDGAVEIAEQRRPLQLLAPARTVTLSLAVYGGLNGIHTFNQKCLEEKAHSTYGCIAGAFGLATSLTLLPITYETYHFWRLKNVIGYNRANAELILTALDRSIFAETILWYGFSIFDGVDTLHNFSIDEKEGKEISEALKFLMRLDITARLSRSLP